MVDAPPARRAVHALRDPRDTSALSPAPAFADYLTWRAGLDDEPARHAWHTALDGLEEPTLLVPESSDASMTPGRVSRWLSEESTAELTALARRHGFTLNTLVQGAWALTLAGLTGRQDVVFGATVSGRPRRFRVSSRWPASSSTHCPSGSGCAMTRPSRSCSPVCRRSNWT
ncbi:condensation domain-containing protein [Streptomyces sp. INA 01156]